MGIGFAANQMVPVIFLVLLAEVSVVITLSLAPILVSSLLIPHEPLHRIELLFKESSCRTIYITSTNHSGNFLYVLVLHLNKKKWGCSQSFPPETTTNEAHFLDVSNQKQTNWGLKVGSGGRGWMGVRGWSLRTTHVL